LEVKPVQNRLPPNPVSLDIMGHRDFDTAREPGVMECWSIEKKQKSITPLLQYSKEMGLFLLESIQRPFLA
jgi:hypothetical protein